MVVKDVDYYLSLSVNDLYNAVSKGNSISSCSNVISRGNAICYFYVRCQYPGRSSPNFCPLYGYGQGTGCVKAPG